MDTRQRSTALFPRALRWGVLLTVLLTVALLFSGCGQGVSVTAFPQVDDSTGLAIAMASLESQMTAFAAKYKDTDEVAYTPGDGVKKALGFSEEQLTSIEPYTSARAMFLLGYFQELKHNYRDALATYQAVEHSPTPYGAQAYYRAGVLGMRSALDVKSLKSFAGTDKLNDYALLVGSSAPEAHNIAKMSWRPLISKHDQPNMLDRLLSNAQPQHFNIIERVLPGVATEDGIAVPALAGEGGLATVGDAGTATGPVILPNEQMSKTALADLDVLYRFGTGTDVIYYNTVKGIVQAFGFAGNFGPVLALLFLALLVKVVTIPLTNKSFRGMRDMQRIQPILKELQEKYKDDKARFAEEQMRVMKEHNVNPMGGCLPMLIQLPIFIIVYSAVQVYAYGFWNAKFLWIYSLALPDFPLLLLYLVSMILSQKLSPTTANADPAMKQQQQMMTWLMPVFLVFVLKDFASAFVLYWLFLNIFTTVHQYYLLQQFAREEAAAGMMPPGTPSSPATRRQERNEQSNTDSFTNTRKKGKRR